MSKRGVPVTRIRARCPRCGDVEFALGKIVVVVADDRPSRSYRFACPTCDRSVTREALPEVIDLLLSAGVVLAERSSGPSDRPSGERPADPASAPARATLSGAAPPLCDDDIDAFRALLDRPGWFRELEALVRDEPDAA